MKAIKQDSHYSFYPDGLVICAYLPNDTSPADRDILADIIQFANRDKVPLRVVCRNGMAGLRFTMSHTPNAGPTRHSAEIEHTLIPEFRQTGATMLAAEIKALGQK